MGSRFEAIRFAVEYDLYMDILPGDRADMPNGCTAGYYMGPRFNPGTLKEKWDPHPKPAADKCPRPHFVPMACHKCWFWNRKTWRHMRTYCPEAQQMRSLRAEYKHVGVEFTGWPVRPKPKPIKGPQLPD